MNIHPIHRVRDFSIVAPYTLRVVFDDGAEQTIDFQRVLAGELFAPLREIRLFNQVRIDPEVHTLVWPNGADFDPATLHDWPDCVEALSAQAARWDLDSDQSRRSQVEPRPVGLCAGKFTVPDDFDRPLPDDILDAFEKV